MKTLLPIIISGFVLCGFFAVSLSAFLLPMSEPESEPEPVPVQRVFYEEPQVLYYDFSRTDNLFSIFVPFYEAGISDSSKYRYSFYYFERGVPSSLVLSRSSPYYRCTSSQFDTLYDSNNLSIYVVAVNRTDITDRYTWYFQYYFLPFPSSGSSSSSRSVLSDLDSQNEDVSNLEVKNEEVSKSEPDIEEVIDPDSEG